MLTPASHGKFTDHSRYSENKKEDQIDQNKGGTAVLTAKVRKFPNISDADRTACRNKNKAKT